MPGFDGTGPLGQGPLTGGGRGYCVVPAEPEGRVPTGYTRVQGYSESPYNSYGSNYIRYGFHSYNYPWYAGNRGPMLPLARPVGVRGYGRFSRIGRGTGMSRRGRRF